MAQVMRTWPVLPAGAEQMGWHLFVVLIYISLAFSQVKRLAACSPTSGGPLL